MAGEASFPGCSPSRAPAGRGLALLLGLFALLASLTLCAPSARASAALPSAVVEPRAAPSAAEDAAASEAAPERSGAGPMDPAVRAYRDGDYGTARALWMARLEGPGGPEGRERARVLYALGNVAAREGRWPEAAGWYEASLRLRPRDADAWANLELARGRAGLPPADRGDLSSTVSRLLSLSTPEESRWLALLGLVLAALAFTFEALRGGALGRRVAVAGALALLVLATPWARHLAARGADPVRVIAQGGVAARSEPREDAAPVAELAPDMRLERLETFLDWTQLRLPAGEAAWVPSHAVFALDR